MATATATASRKGDHDCPELPPDTLRLILASLPIKSRVRARAVCAAWSSALPDKIDPFPWLLRLPPAHGDAAAAAASSPAVFFPSTGTSAGFELPFHRPGTRCVGMHDGWIAAVDVDLGVRILDPLSGARVDLPPLTACPGVGFGRGRASRRLHEQVEYRQSPTAVTDCFARESNRRLTGVGTFDVKSGSLEMLWKDGAGDDPLEACRAPTWFAPPSFFR
uniref:Uncharacterized protein n=1 Tax=Oryza barthii TaxID=65489 RepID=A0A0D3GQD5_9ORYZ